VRLIARYPSLSAAEERAAFLRSRGIATHVSELTVLKPGLTRGQADRAALWAVLAAQYEDALKLLEDADHQPVNALDESRMQILQEEGPVQARRVMIRGLLITLGALLGLLGLVLYLGP